METASPQHTKLWWSVTATAAAVATSVTQNYFNRKSKNKKKQKICVVY